MPVLPTLRAAAPLDASDDSRLLFSDDLTETLSRALDNMPSDFQTMDSGLTWTVEERENLTGNDDDYTLEIRIVNGATILAAADSGGTFATVIAHTANSSTHTTDVTRGPTAFAYVNTTADKATWDGASVELRQTYAQSMAKDTIHMEVDVVGFDGNYTAAPVSGTVAATQAGDTADANGVLKYSGTATPTQAADTGDANGWIEVTGSVAASQAADTADATGQLGADGTVSATQGADTGDITGQLGADGTVAAVQAGDTADINGSVVDPGRTGTVAATQGADTADAAGTFTTTGSVAAAQAGDTGDANGWVEVTGPVAATQDAQTGDAVGSVKLLGSVAAVQAGDTGAAAGVFTPQRTGTVAATQQADTAAAVGWIEITGSVAVSQPSDTGQIRGVRLHKFRRPPGRSVGEKNAHHVAGSKQPVRITGAVAAASVGDTTKHGRVGE